MVRVAARFVGCGLPRQVCSAVARQHQARLDALPQLAPRSPAPSAAATAVKHAEGSERTDLRTQESHAWGELMATFVSEAELLMWHARRQRSALLLDPERHEIVRSQHLNELQVYVRVCMCVCVCGA